MKLGKDYLEKSEGVPRFTHKKAAVLQDGHPQGGDAEPGCPADVRSPSQCAAPVTPQNRSRSAAVPRRRRQERGGTGRDRLLADGSWDGQKFCCGQR